nr:primase-helicase family protein [Propylenella binzhouense]
MSSLYAGASAGYLNVWRQKSGQTNFFSWSQLDEAEAFMLQAAENDNVYHSIGLQHNALNGRKSAGVCGVPCISFDADLCSDVRGVHAKTDLPATGDEALDFVREIGLPDPTAIINSGNGQYWQWRLPNIWEFVSNAERDRMAWLSKAWHNLIIGAAKKKGWTFDNTSDLVRLTRIPGTFNHKTNPPKLVTLVSLDLEKRYSPQDLEEVLQAVAQRLGVTTSKPATSRGGLPEFLAANDNSSSDRERLRLTAITAGCRWVRSCVCRMEHLPEPEWYALSSIVGRCDKGEQAFHQLSKADPRYNEEETQAKLHRALESAGPRTCDSIASELACVDCTGCPFRGGALKTPLQLGRLSPAAAELMANHVLVINTGLFVDLSTMRTYSERAFKNKFRHMTGDKTPVSLLIEHRFTRKVEAVDYLPGVEQRFIPTSSGDVLNAWQDTGVQPEAGDASIIHEHLEYLIPNEVERRHLLDSFAHLVQQPTAKLRHVLALIGGQGTGKSFLGAVLGRIVGSENVITCENSDLESRFNAHLGNRRAAVLEELGIMKRKDIYEAVKRFIADDHMQVEEKAIPRFTARTPKLILAFSNHLRPTDLPQGDRRFWICRSDVDRQSDAYYNRLWNEGLDQVPVFVHDLLRRDITGFDPDAPPPMTAAKAEIIEASRPVTEQELRAMIEDGAHPFHRELFTVDDVRTGLVSRMARTPTRNELSNYLKQLGAVNLEQLRVGDGARERLWALKRPDYWRNATPAERAQELARRA